MLDHDNVSAKTSDSLTTEPSDPVLVPESSLFRWATRTSSTGSTPPRGLFLSSAGLSVSVPLTGHGRRLPRFFLSREIGLGFRVLIAGVLNPLY